MEQQKRRHLAVYFANWNMPKGVEAASLPWDDLTDVCHAFWAIEPTEGGMDSFQRRAAGLPPRTRFRLVSLHPEWDLDCPGRSRVDPALPRSHFGQYEALTRRHPGVRVLLSVGGWTRCGYFSEMAASSQGRQSFIGECLRLIQAHPWLGGIDIDWEYPARERTGDGPDDEGCPVFGTPQEDRENFVRLLRELRQAMDQAFGSDVKALTACSVGDPVGLACQDWVRAAACLDRIHIMTYDLAGIWSGAASHTSSAAQARQAAGYLTSLGIPADKLCIGSALYASPMRLTGSVREGILGTAVEDRKPTDALIDQMRLRELEAQAAENGADAPGWHMGYDRESGGAYLWNDDPSAPDYRWFLSYENPRSLQAKIDVIRDMGLAGMIVWEASNDTVDHAMLRQMGAELSMPIKV